MEPCKTQKRHFYKLSIVERHIQFKNAQLRANVHTWKTCNLCGAYIIVADKELMLESIKEKNDKLERQQRHFYDHVKKWKDIKKTYTRKDLLAVDWSLVDY